MTHLQNYNQYYNRELYIKGASKILCFFPSNDLEKDNIFEHHDNLRFINFQLDYHAWNIYGRRHIFIHIMCLPDLFFVRLIWRLK